MPKLRRVWRCFCSLLAIAPAAFAADTYTFDAGIEDLNVYYPTYLANGYFSLASTPLGSDPASSLMAGVMDESPADVARPAAVPSWNTVDYFDGRHWLNESAPTAATHIDYHQLLDVRHASLTTRYSWHHDGHDTDVELGERISEKDANLAAVSLTIRPHFSGPVKLRFTFNPERAPRRFALAKMNAEQFAQAAREANAADAAVGGKRNAIWYPGEVRLKSHGSNAAKRLLWLTGRALDGGRFELAASIAAPASFKQVRSVAEANSASFGLELAGTVQAGKVYRFTKFVAASAAGWKGHEVVTQAAALAARHDGLDEFIARHQAVWEELWRSDVAVEANEALQRTLHSDLFYLLENTTPDEPWPVAACGFSPNYFGHVFWDNDFWVFPALLLLHPERARGLIEFRERFLGPAQQRAAAQHLKGAMYPWEADPSTGRDVTPGFAIENADREIHVNGAVALAQWQYYLASGDRTWLAEHAWPVISAVADFWASRATWVADRQRFEIDDVTSPEEDYMHVDNEIYTNAVAQASLARAGAAAKILGQAANPRWSEVADKLYQPTTGERGVYHDFDPSIPHDKTSSWMATSVPMLSIPALDFQAPRATLAGLFEHSVEAVSKVRSHANQMILVMLALQAADLGKSAYFEDVVGGGGKTDPFLKPPFNVRSETPQNDSTYLLASSGGFLQAFIFGLSGLRLGAAGLEARYEPNLPPSIRSLTLKGIRVRNQILDIQLRRDAAGKVQRIESPAETSQGSAGGH